MGDNRDNSTDSRWQDIGAINKKNIVGNLHRNTTKNIMLIYRDNI